MDKKYGLKCRIGVGTFSGERTCNFRAYNSEGHLVASSHQAPRGYVDEDRNLVRLNSYKIEGNKANVRIAHAGSGDFSDFLVNIEDLVEL